MKGIKWLISFTALVMLLSGLLAGDYAWAGDGDGSGGGKNNPLTIVSTIPADGATGVNNLEFIKLTFSKNVVYMTVRENNQQCFSLWAENKQIPVEIIMADDQIEREKRNDVIIKPLEPLQAGTTYRVEAAPEIESKSGVTLGKKTTVSFTMAGDKIAATPVNDGPAETAVIPENETEAAVEATAAASKDNEAAGDHGINNGEAVESDQDSEQKPASDINKAAVDEQHQTAAEKASSDTSQMKNLKIAGILILAIALAVPVIRWGFRKLNTIDKD